jgi:predicted O-methyltransferase YrrM
MMDIDDITRCIADTISAGMLVEPPAGLLSGYSGKRVVGLLQRLVQGAVKQQRCYLEVGVFQGLTLLSTAYACKEMACFGIDNFALFDPEGRNFDIVQSRRDALGARNARVINKDYEDALEALSESIGSSRIAVYFVDGPHDYRSQLMCLQLALPWLADDCVIVVDDCNYRHVRQANRDFLKTHPGFRLAFEAYTPCHPLNMDTAEAVKARDGWWNGINVLIRDAAGSCPVSYPETHRSRALYENEHIVHAAQYGFCAPEAVEVVGAFMRRSPKRLLRALLALVRRVRRRRTEEVGRYAAANTYSENLPQTRFVKAVDTLMGSR